MLALHESGEKTQSKKFYDSKKAHGKTWHIFTILKRVCIEVGLPTICRVQCWHERNLERRRLKFIHA